jgi:hypothetical protein
MIYGWDISTSIVGVAQFNDEGGFSWAKHVDLRKIEDMNEKASAVHDFVIDHYIDHTPNNHFVEERLGGFMAGRTSAQVLMKLGAFNAVVCYILHLFDEEGRVHHLHPSTWKSLMKRDGLFIPKGVSGDAKKQLTLDFVRGHAAGFPDDRNRNDKPQPWMFDMADAYCIGRAGYWQLCKEKESSPPSEGA